VKPINALRATIFLVFLLLMPSLGFPADLPVGTVTAPVPVEICFPLQDGERILKDLEALPICREAVTAAEEALNSSELRAETLDNRIVEQDKELTDARKLVDDTRKAGEEAAKVASGPWYQKVLNAGKSIGLGIVLGFVIGL